MPKPELYCLAFWFFFFQMGDWISSMLSLLTGILTSFWPMGSYCLNLVGGSGMVGRMLLMRP